MNAVAMPFNKTFIINLYIVQISIYVFIIIVFLSLFLHIAVNLQDDLSVDFGYLLETLVAY